MIVLVFFIVSGDRKGERMKKTLSLLLISVLLMSGCSKSDQSGAEEAARSFAESSLAYAFDEARKVATGEALEGIDLVESYIDYTSLNAEIDSIQVLDSSGSGDTAEVKLQVTRSVNDDNVITTEQRTLLARCVQINNTWYVYETSILKFNE